MTLLDRYLAAVRDALPSSAPADDIVAELGEDLDERIAARAASLGRPLSDDEIAAMLKAQGHPRVIAARYGGVPFLIGPQTLPFYWATLRAVAVTVVVLELLGGAAGSLVTHDAGAVFAALGSAGQSLVWVFAIVTAVFAASERVADGRGGVERLVGRWDPRRLPMPTADRPISRAASLPSLVVNLFVLVVLIDAGGAQRTPLTRTIVAALREAHVSLTSAWHAAYLGALAATALVAAGALLAFVRPQASRVYELLQALASAATIVGAAVTLRGGPWFTPDAAVLNLAAAATLWVTIAIASVQWLVSLRRLMQRIALRRVVASS